MAPTLSSVGALLWPSFSSWRLISSFVSPAVRKGSGSSLQCCTTAGFWPAAQTSLFTLYPEKKRQSSRKITIKMDTRYGIIGAPLFDGCWRIACSPSPRIDLTEILLFPGRRESDRVWRRILLKKYLREGIVQKTLKLHNNSLKGGFPWHSNASYAQKQLTSTKKYAVTVHSPWPRHREAPRDGHSVKRKSPCAALHLQIC